MGQLIFISSNLPSQESRYAIVVLDRIPPRFIMDPSERALDLGATIEFERIAVTAFKVSPKPERA